MIYIFIGPSASGKDTFSSMMSERMNIPKITLYTTRPKRDYEIDGVDYYFVNNDQFQYLVETKKIFCYGSYTSMIDNNPEIWYYGCQCNFDKSSKDRILCMDIAKLDIFFEKFGANNITVIYILANSDVRKQRAIERGNFNEDEWNSRLKTDNQKFGDLNAINEMIYETYKAKDYIILGNSNRNKEDVYKKLVDVIDNYNHFISTCKNPDIARTYSIC